MSSGSSRPAGSVPREVRVTPQHLGRDSGLAAKIATMEHAALAGTVRVANEVIASIAAMAAREVDEVEGLDEASARHFGDWIKRETAHRGVRVALDTERKIHLDVFLTVSAGAVLRDVAEKVQDNVIEAVQRMLALEVAEVNVFVSSIAFSA